MKSAAQKENFFSALRRIGDKGAAAVLRFLTENGIVFVLLAATVLSLAARFLASPYPTRDVVGYVFAWMKDIRAAGLKNFYSVNADYSPLYLFFVGLLSLVPGGKEVTVGAYTYPSTWMTVLKGSYFVFDLLNALTVALIIRKLTGSKGKAAAGYLVMTVLPVQFINSAVWGNADAVYACFLLYTLYFSLCGKSKTAFAFFGLALANKLQALFLAPFLLYLLLRRKLKFSSVLLVPVAVTASFLPAYFCGASFFEPFGFFGKQVDGYSKLTLGCPNFWQLFAFREENAKLLGTGATVFGLLAIGVFFALLWLRFIRPTNENLLTAAAFLVGITVFFLPHMHERYFYLLDVLTVAAAFVRGKRYFLIPVMQLASGIAYCHYISGKYFIAPWGEDSVHIAAVLVAFTLGVLLYDLMKAPTLSLQEELCRLDPSAQEGEQP